MSGYRYSSRARPVRDPQVQVLDQRLAVLGEQIPIVALACLRGRIDAASQVRAALDAVTEARRALAALEERHHDEQQNPSGGS